MTAENTNKIKGISNEFKNSHVCVQLFRINNFIFFIQSSDLIMNNFYDNVTTATTRHLFVSNNFFLLMKDSHFKTREKKLNGLTKIEMKTV